MELMDTIEVSMPIRILCVEDYADIARYLRMLLEFDGYEVTIADSLAQGLTSIRTQPFDLILLDYGLPYGTGLDLCREARRAGVRTPIVFFTVNDDPFLKSLAVGAGAQDFIKKGADTKDLLNAIATYAKAASVSEPLGQITA